MALFDEIRAKITGRMTIAPEEAQLLAEATKASREHVVIGCVWGDTAILSAKAGAGQLYVIEPMDKGFWVVGDPVTGRRPTADTLAANLSAAGVLGKVQVIRQRPAPWPLPHLKPDSVFIDGDHSYEGALRDWHTASAIAQKAVIFHDADEDHPGVLRVVREHAARSREWAQTRQAGSLVVFERVSALPPAALDHSPVVSVIVPTYNRPELLRRALASVQAQTFTDFEILVTNDAGMSVSKIVSEFPGARHFRHKANRGLPAARNTAIRHAKGYYIAYLDDDDWYYRKHLETLLRGLAASRARAAYSDAHCDELEAPSRRVYSSREYSLAALREKSLFSVCCVMHERSLLDEVGYFDETLPNHEDYDLWNRIASVTDFYHVKEPTCVIDRTRATMNSDRAAMLAGLALVRSRYNGGSRA